MSEQIHVHLTSQALSPAPSMSNEISKLAQALAKAEAEIKGAEKDSQNPFFKSNYADLASNIEATRESFGKYGLSVTQTVYTDNDGHYVQTLLLHESGQWISSGRFKLPQVQNNDPQKVLAALTYYRRGQFAAICRLAQIDEDGNDLVAKPTAQPQRPQQQAPRPQTPPPPAKPQNFAPQTQAEAQAKARGLQLDPETQARVQKLSNQT